MDRHKWRVGPDNVVPVPNRWDSPIAHAVECAQTGISDVVRAYSLYLEQCYDAREVREVNGGQVEAGLVMQRRLIKSLSNGQIRYPVPS